MLALSGYPVGEPIAEALRRHKVQVISKAPYSSRDPCLRAEAIVRERVDSIGTLPVDQHPARIAELFEQVGLRPVSTRLLQKHKVACINA